MDCTSVGKIVSIRVVGCLWTLWSLDALSRDAHHLELCDVSSWPLRLMTWSLSCAETPELKTAMPWEFSTAFHNNHKFTWPTVSIWGCGDWFFWSLGGWLSILKQSLLSLVCYEMLPVDTSIRSCVSVHLMNKVHHPFFFLLSLGLHKLTIKLLKFTQHWFSFCSLKWHI